MYVHVCARVRVCARVFACVRACVCLRLCACAHTNACAQVHTHACTHAHAHACAHTHAHIQAESLTKLFPDGSALAKVFEAQELRDDALKKREEEIKQRLDILSLAVGILVFVLLAQSHGFGGALNTVFKSVLRI